MPAINSKDLSTDALEIAAAYATAYPKRPARTKVVSWINNARRQQGIRGMKPDEARLAIKELVEARLLTPSIEGQRGTSAKGPSAIPGTITRLCEIALEKQIALYVVEGLEAELQYSYDRSAQVTGQHLRCALILGQEDYIEDYRLSDDDWLWMLEPGAKPYLINLPGRHRQHACEVCLRHVVTNIKPASVFIDTCKACAPAYEELIPLVSLSHIISGDFKSARDCFKSLPAKVQTSKPMAVAALANEALIATLQGDDVLAFKKINNCIEAEKVGTRKRKVYPAYTTFSLSLLSLFRSPSPDGVALLRSLRSMVKTSEQASQFESLFSMAEQAQHPEQYYRSFETPKRDLKSLLMVIAGQWGSNRTSVDTDTSCRNLQAIFVRAEYSGYQWVAAEALSVLESIEKTTELDPEYLKLSANQRHQQLGTQTLTELITTLESWEMSLQTLESLIPKQSTTGKTTKTRATKESRLIWQVTPFEYGEFDISPLEQRLNKNGKWSTGRPISLKRLHNKAHDIDYLTDQDKRASAAIDSWSQGWGSSSHEYEVGARAVYQLTGHSNVIDTFGEKIEVVELIPKLKIDSSGDHLKLSFEPELIGSGNYQMQLTPCGSQLEVTHFTAAQARISDAIEANGVKIPLAAKQRLLDIAAALATDIPVHSDAQDTTGEQYQGDSEPVLQLDYIDNTLTIRIQVEPLANSEQFFDAAEGGDVVYIKGEKGSMQVIRDLPLEQELMHALVNSSATLSQAYDGRPQIQLQGTESILELLDELQQRQVRCLWPRDVKLKVAARADSKQLTLKIKSAKEWFSASGELKYSDEDSLSLAQLLTLINKSPRSRFIELAAGEFLALSETLKQQLQAMQTYGTAQSSRDGEQRLHSLSMLALDPLLDTAAVSADKQWQQWRKKIQQSNKKTPKVPTTLQAELRPYQLEGFQWLSRISELGAGACLADDMGLGKTLQALALLLQRAPDGAAIVVAPTSVTGNWIQEAQRFAPTLNIKLYGGTADERAQAIEQAKPFDLIIISYGLLHNDIDKLIAVHWHSIVLDEAQAIKNSATQRAKAARSLNGNFKLATTGTPIQNNLMDLHSLFTFLIPGFLGSAAKFKKTFALPIERDNNDDARQQLRSLVAPFMLRRHKREVLKDLPARTDITLSVELSGEEAALYDTLRQQALDAVTDSQNNSADGGKKLRVLAELTRLRRLCCNPQLIESDWAGPMAKLSLFASTIDELLANKHKVLVFSQFVDHLKILETHLKQENINYQYLDGSTTAKQRTQSVTSFQSGEGDVFLISLTAGGTGLNLTAADYVIHMDPWWNPAVEDQASDRAHRIGQQRPVTIYRMVTAGTIEEQIQQLHATKRELADSLLANTDSAKFDLDALVKMLQAPIDQG